MHLGGDVQEQEYLWSMQKQTLRRGAVQNCFLLLCSPQALRPLTATYLRDAPGCHVALLLSPNSPSIGQSFLTARLKQGCTSNACSFFNWWSHEGSMQAIFITPVGRSDPPSPMCCPWLSSCVYCNCKFCYSKLCNIINLPSFAKGITGVGLM